MVFICLFTTLFIYLFTFYLFIYLFTTLFIYFIFTLYLFIYLFTTYFIYLLFIYFLFIYLLTTDLLLFTIPISLINKSINMMSFADIFINQWKCSKVKSWTKYNETPPLPPNQCCDNAWWPLQCTPQWFDIFLNIGWGSGGVSH